MNSVRLFEKAQVLVAVLIAFTIILTLGTAIIMHSRNVSSNVKLQTDSEKAYAIAQSGIEIGKAFWAKNGDGTTGYNKPDERVTVSILTVNGDTTATSESFYKGSTYKVIKVINRSSIQPATWANVYYGDGSDYLHTVVATADGYAVLGHSNTASWASGMYDLILLKLAANGDVSWARSFGSLQDDRTVINEGSSRDLLALADGYIFGGYTASTDWSRGSDDIIVIKTDKTGSVGAAGTWSKVYGDTGTDRLYCIQKGIGGGFILGGATTSYKIRSNDCYVIKINDDGSVGWGGTYGTTGGIEAIMDIETFNDNSGYLLAGYTDSWGKGLSDGFVVKMDTNGTPVWAYAYGDTRNDRFLSVKKSFNASGAQDGFILSGIVYDTYRHMLVAKIDLAGTLLWTKEFGPGDPYYAYSNVVLQADDKDYVFGGLFEHNAELDFGLFKLANSGNPLQFKGFYGRHTATDKDVFQALDKSGEGYVLGGYNNGIATITDDFLVIRTDSIGAIGTCDLYQNTLNVSPYAPTFFTTTVSVPFTSRTVTPLAVSVLTKKHPDNFTVNKKPVCQ